MEVVETDIPFCKSLKDTKCWLDEDEFKRGVENNKYFRMKLVSETTSDLLTIDELHRYGVKGYFYGPRTIDRELIQYIDNVFDEH